MTVSPPLTPPYAHFKFESLILPSLNPPTHSPQHFLPTSIFGTFSLLFSALMTAPKKAPLLSIHPNSTSYNSLYHNPLTDISPTPSDKENVAPIANRTGCGHGHAFAASLKAKKLQLQAPLAKEHKTKPSPKASSLQLCIRLNEPDSALGAPMPWDPLSLSSDMWDFSDSEAAPASSWSTLPNRSLLCRPIPLDVGRCTCIIAKESAQGPDGVSVYSLYTNEGYGRQDRKLAIARHRRRNGRSEFIVAQNSKGLLCSSDESSLGIITANLIGSKYQIWDQGRALDFLRTQSKRLLGVVAFVPTITTLTGSFRSMRAWIPKQQSMQLKSTNTNQVQHVCGLPKDWEEKRNRAHQLFSRVPYYNNITKRNELDFRQRAGRAMPRIKTSMKNFQLTMEENGKQTILQLGRISKSKYVMDFRYPLTGYQAFCICLASIDSKLCCSV